MEGSFDDVVGAEVAVVPVGLAVDVSVVAATVVVVVVVGAAGVLLENISAEEVGVVDVEGYRWAIGAGGTPVITIPWFSGVWGSTCIGELSADKRCGLDESIAKGDTVEK